MKLQITLSKRDIDALKTMAMHAQAEADAMLSDNNDKNQMKEAYKIEHGIALVDELIDMATTPKEPT